MSIKSLNNPFDGEKSLIHSKHCTCHDCRDGVPAAINRESVGAMGPDGPDDSEAMLDRAVESAVVRSVFGHNDFSRRSFMQLMGGGTAAALLSSVFPLEKAKAAVKESMGKLEKTKLNVGFVPITCATPIIMAHPMGFYERYGLDVTVTKTAGCAPGHDHGGRVNARALHHARGGEH